MPPAALIASAAIWAPSRQSPPTSAMAPVIGLTTPTLTVLPWAPSRGGAATTAAVVRAPFRNVRRLMRARVMARLLRGWDVAPILSLACPPDARVVLGHLAAHRADVGMAPGLD